MSIQGRIHFFTLVTVLLLTTWLSAQRNFGHDHHVFHRPPTQSRHAVAQSSSPARKRIGGVSPASKADKPVAAGTGVSH
jgi:hypothetical protein